jgi:hypothetical protein
MQIKILFFYLFFYLPINMTSSLASENRTDLFNKRVLLFEKMCIENGALNSIIINSTGESLDCQAEAYNLKKEEKAIDYIQAKPAVPISQLSCMEKNNFNDQITKLSDESLEAANSLSCNKEEAKKEELSCMQQVGCNALRSTNLESVLSIFKGKLKDDSCLATNKSDCLSELVAGLLKNLWSNASNFWEILKIISKTSLISIPNTIKSWIQLTDPINEHADSALAAGNLNEHSLKLFMNDAKTAIMKMSEYVYQLIAKGIKESFMCKKWADQPHLSQCLVPQDQPWLCANCDQKMNSICGVAGFAAGEIAVAYATGGVLNLGKSAVDSVGLTSAITRLSENYPKIGKAKKIFIKIEKLNLSIIDVALKNKIVIKTVRVVSYPISPYTNLMQKAYTAGMKDSKLFVNKFSTLEEIELLTPENILIQANAHVIAQYKSYTKQITDEKTEVKPKKTIKEKKQAD